MAEPESESVQQQQNEAVDEPEEQVSKKRRYRKDKPWDTDDIGEHMGDQECLCLFH